MNSCIQFLNNYFLDDKATHFRSGGLGSNLAVPEALFSLGAFHLSELTGQPIPIVIRISLLIKTNYPDQSNPKRYALR